MKTEAEKAFLQGLKDLTVKTGISIAGCGCCGSPYLVEINKEYLEDDARYGYGNADEITWLPSSNQWDWESYKGSIFY